MAMELKPPPLWRLLEIFMVLWCETGCLHQTQKKLYKELKQINLIMKLPKLIILCGLPGSGKSYFSEHLAELKNVTVVSRDQLGSNDECDKVFMKGIKNKNMTVVVDKCNPTPKDREGWIKMAMISKKKVVVIYFDVDAQECIKRVKNRVGHPTIPFGRGESVVRSFDKQMIIPTDKEGYKVVKLESSFSVDELLRKMGCTVKDKTLKFPRTHHIFDAGRAKGVKGTGVTRDDLLLSDDEIDKFLNVELIIQEKLDGANLGVMIDEDYQVIYKNRSHYVTYETSTQFKGLKAWQENHSGELYMILKPNRYILYGEWCWAKHSIYYDRLPDYFVAFDVFDKKENKFLSQAKLQEFLAETTIPIVPTICKQSFATKKELVNKLLELLDTKSAYNDEPVEGVVLRVDNGDYFDRRCKLVRPDFIQGIEEHWSKKELVRNKKI